MTQREQPSQEKEGTKSGERFNFGAALAIGVSLGLIFGMMLGHTAFGITTGLLLATVVNAYNEKKQGKPQANIALAVSLGALLLMIVIWMLSPLGWL